MSDSDTFELNTREDKERYNELTDPDPGVFDFSGYLEDGMYAGMREKEDDIRGSVGSLSSRYD